MKEAYAASTRASAGARRCAPARTAAHLDLLRVFNHGEYSPDTAQREARRPWIRLLAPVFLIQNNHQDRKTPNARNFIPDERTHTNTPLHGNSRPKQMINPFIKYP